MTNFKLLSIRVIKRAVSIACFIVIFTAVFVTKTYIDVIPPIFALALNSLCYNLCRISLLPIQFVTDEEIQELDSQTEKEKNK